MKRIPLLEEDMKNSRLGITTTPCLAALLERGTEVIPGEPSTLVEQLLHKSEQAPAEAREPKEQPNTQ